MTGSLWSVWVDGHNWTGNEVVSWETANEIADAWFSFGYRDVWIRQVDESEIPVT